MRRRFNWALSACVTWGLLACGGGAPKETSLLPLGDNAGSGGAASDGEEEPGYGSTIANGFVSEVPGEGGACSGDGCGGGEEPGGGTLCGNRQLDSGEQCDDGNSNSGDGCNGACNLEPNFRCDSLGEACQSTIACGDGKVAGTEACDDGNGADGDGCAADCSVEALYGCTTGANGTSSCIETPAAACGDSMVSAGEQCDDGNSAAGDGCSDSCKVETGFVCPTVGQACQLVEFCGDGYLRAGVEQCDDGNASPVDGCDGFCKILPNFICPTPGQACHSTVVCGDSQLSGNETCDDGNTRSGDGCSSLCRAEPGFSCTGGGASPVPGACAPVPEERCGDSRLAPSEFCDDGNTAASDGCTADCAIEPGFDCPEAPGSLCVRVGSCGDGLVNVLGEQCDDQNSANGDGCTANCQREALFDCPAQGGPCSSTVRCGDGVVNGPETCDDRNTTGADGCNASCRVEPGFVCPAGGVCRSLCGDGIRAGREQCDDGNARTGDGCGADCRLEPGFKCADAAGAATNPDSCSRTTCGDGQLEGTEQCDDGNLAPYDGCDRFCRHEPVCGGSPYACGAVCGDGMKFPEEGCDDGNALDGDGCSSDCALERGFLCSDEAADLGEQLDLPIVFRDFQSSHPQFEVSPDPNGVLAKGIVLQNLSANGKPQYNQAFSFSPGGGISARAWTMDGRKSAGSGSATLNAAQIASNFSQWYVTDGGNNRQVVDLLSLDEIGAGTYQFAASGNNQFFPIDGRGFGQVTQGHNFHFTSEVRQWFLYNPGDELEFSGDDDVWVFVNGKLTVDLGGIHGELRGSITLDGANGESSLLCNPDCSTVNVPMNPDGVNEIAVFQAERHVTQSNYTLTLRGFNAPSTDCASNCGDQIVTADEACDLGSASNTGAYGTCNRDCTLTARCGDGVVNGPEQCDNGVNTSTRLLASGDCAPGCVLPPRCGDGNLDSGFEVCDNGTQNKAPGSYGACDTSCQLGPRCGDGVVQAAAGEQCDTGARNGSGGSPCLATCQLRCGNGQLDQGEQCDDGLANNTGGYGKCEPSCTLGPRCGDAVVDTGAGETCDDGLNDGSYGHCAATCRPGPFCGDGTLQAQFGESCDNGAANVASGYARNLCSTQCKPAPFCGDRAVDVQLGELCDDGVNDGKPGSCSPDCAAAIPPASCGDGVVNAGEACDNGKANNGTAGNSCDVRCELACGNGFVDATEQCDDGVNSGAYGTCNANCTVAAFCGDGIVQGSEACDDGPGNVASASAYGAGVCTTSCARAPRCGDHRVDAAFGEMCDGGLACTSSCSVIR